jgi:CheY-like chemotaxis protein
VLGWWKERVRDARVAGEDEQLPELARAAGSSGPESKSLRRRLESVRRNNEYAEILLLGAHRLVEEWTGEGRPPGPSGKEQARESVRSREIVFEEFRRHGNGSFYATLCIPLAPLETGPPGAAALTRQLLAFSRKQVLMPRVFDLNAAIIDTEGLLRRLAGEHIVLALKLNAHPGEALADQGQVEQLILNLVVNARDALPQGGRIEIETAAVRVEAAERDSAKGAEPGDYVALTIRDNGGGMTEQIRGRIFEPFITTKPTGAGTGLGLSMVHAIVRQSKGWVEVESELGAGATFRVYLPRANGPSGEAAAETATARKAGSGRILVAGDHTEVRRLAAEALRQDGSEVVEARNGKEAAALCSSPDQRFDLLLADVVMPEMNGWDPAIRIRKLRAGLRVILMSGSATSIFAGMELAREGMGFIQKPFSPEELATAVSETLRGP